MENREKIYICLILILILLCLKSCNKATSIKTKDTKKIGINTYKKKAVLNTETITYVHVKGKTSISYDTIPIHDTITKKDSFYIDVTKPIYKLSFKDKWKSGTVVAKFDSLEIKAKFLDYSYVLFEQKRGLFRNKLIFTEIKQANPNAVIRGVTHSAIQPKHKLFNFSLQSGVGIDLVSKKPTVYAGLGLGFDFIR